MAELARAYTIENLVARFKLNPGYAIVCVYVCVLAKLLIFFRHRWTGRYEAHLWDNSCRREGQSRKGRQGIVIIYNFFRVLAG